LLILDSKIELKFEKLGIDYYSKITMGESGNGAYDYFNS
jgi:hypothetical protein